MEVLSWLGFEEGVDGGKGGVEGVYRLDTVVGEWAGEEALEGGEVEEVVRFEFAVLLEGEAVAEFAVFESADLGRAFLFGCFGRSGGFALGGGGESDCRGGERVGLAEDARDGGLDVTELGEVGLPLDEQGVDGDEFV